MRTRSFGEIEAGGAVPPATVKVWDLLVRIFHWSLVASFATAWLAVEEWNAVHEWAGYGALGLVSARLVWGLVGSRYARFANFVRSPGVVIRYLRNMLRGTETRYLGHNPAGAAMVLLLMAGIAGLGVTGWMMTLNAYWGVAWLGELHETIASAMLLLVALHVAGVLLASVRHGENLVAAMFTGRKRQDPS